MDDSFLKKGLSLGIALVCSFGITNSVFAANVGKINADNVNIRTQASTSSEIMKMLSEGEKVSVVANVDGWYKLTTAAGGVAYVKQDYVTIAQVDAVVTDDFINVRISPSLTADVIGKVNKGQTIAVTGVVNDEWYSVFYNGTSAYIHCDYLTGDMLDYVKGATAKNTAVKPADNDTVKIENDMYALVTSTSLNLREEASTDSDVIKRYENGYALSISGSENGWLKVTDDDGVTGYVKSDYVSLKNGSKPENKKATVKKATKTHDNKLASDETVVDMIDYAKQFIGTPYVYGGTDLTAGVDCSGFTYSVYRDFGITLERRSRDQVKNGDFVEKEDLQAGDLVFFNTGGESEISHVGMYIGDGEYIHSTDGAAQGVTISDLGSDYAERTYVGAVRVLD